MPCWRLCGTAPEAHPRSSSCRAPFIHPLRVPELSGRAKPPARPPALCPLRSVASFNSASSIELTRASSPLLPFCCASASQFSPSVRSPRAAHCMHHFTLPARLSCSQVTLAQWTPHKCKQACCRVLRCALRAAPQDKSPAAASLVAHWPAHATDKRAGLLKLLTPGALACSCARHQAAKLLIADLQAQVSARWRRGREQHSYGTGRALAGHRGGRQKWCRGRGGLR